MQATAGFRPPHPDRPRDAPVLGDVGTEAVLDAVPLVPAADGRRLQRGRSRRQSVAASACSRLEIDIGERNSALLRGHSDAFEFSALGEVIPLAATTIFAPESAKSVVSPDIVSVIVLPSPPFVLMDETTVPAAAEQAIVVFNGVSTIASCDGGCLTESLTLAACQEVPIAAPKNTAAAIIHTRLIIHLTSLLSFPTC